MEECCVICAEPLTHVAYGPCGHRDACVECVARLRFVMDDERCVICQQRCPSMFATRAMGDYTETIGAEAFAELPGRARSRELHHDKKLNIFFDDLAVCRKVEQLRGLSCSVCAADDASDARQNSNAFGSLKQLKAHLRDVHDKFFCEVCLEGRKVFVSQQVLYSRQDLERHKKGLASELDAPLGGFAGHPGCKFCRKNFYDESAMYHHMQSAHETCHLCRRSSPESFVYYKDYEDLERHYNTGHHPCLHPECLAKKFVVFQSPQELKNHEGLEHGRAMTKAERKEALRVHVDFNAATERGGAQRDRDPRVNSGASAEDERRRRAAREIAARAAQGASDAERAQIEAVLRASQLELDHGGASMPRPPSMEEFPDLRAAGGGSSSRLGGGNLVAGGWAGRARGASTGGGGARIGGSEDFPSLSSRVGGSNPPHSSQQQTRRMPAPMPELPVRAAEHLAARLAGLSAGRAAAGAAAGPGPGPPAPPAPGPGDFPSLGGAGRLAGAPGSPGSSSRAFPMSTADKLAMKRAADARRLAPGAPPAEPEFRRVGGRGRGSRWNFGALDLQTSAALSQTADPDALPKPPSKKEAARVEAENERLATEALETAARNDRLVAGIRSALEKRGASFDVFANVSSQFKDGRVTASAYFAKVSAMGIELDNVKELARLMPDELRRMELFKAIAARERFLARASGGTDSVDAAAALLFGGSNESHSGSSSGSSSGLPTTWDCPACTFRNHAKSARCDVCDGAPLGGGAAPAAAVVPGPGSNPGGGGGGKGGKRKKKAVGTKISLTAVGGAGVGGLDEFIPGREKAAWGT